MKKRWLLLAAFIALLAAAFAILTIISEPADDHNFFSEGPARPWVIAHQGGDGLWPGNTMYAFEHAAVMGVDVLEMDIHSTADGHLVTMHDATVDRTTNGTGPINEYSLDELLKLDAGFWWSDDEGKSYPYRGAGITAAALDDVFATFPEYRMNIEIKQSSPSIAEAFCAKIREYGMEKQVLVASFRQEAMEAFRQECPEVATSTGRSEVTRFYIFSSLFMESILSPNAHALQVPEYEGKLKVLSQRFVDGAKNRNIEVHAWTINEVEDMERILELGVDGIITDYPDRLMALLNR